MPFNRAEYYRKRAKVRTERAIQQLGGKCVRCGATERLQFDHIDPATKRGNISTMVTWASEATLQEELAKCQLLCESSFGCHRAKTMEERGHKPAVGTHGTLSAYRYCRCALCRAANTEWTRKYRRTHPR